MELIEKMMWGGFLIIMIIGFGVLCHSTFQTETEVIKCKTIENQCGIYNCLQNVNGLSDSNGILQVAAMNCLIETNSINKE